MKKTQAGLVLMHLKDKGTITSWTAIQKFRITRLAAIIYSLKERGYIIETKIRWRENKHWAEYIFKGKRELNPEQIEVDFEDV